MLLIEGLLAKVEAGLPLEVTGAGVMMGNPT
jgi:hypothetical protein